MWYYYLMNLLEESEIATDDYMNFLLEYKDKHLVDKFTNSVARQHISIVVHPKQPVISHCEDFRGPCPNRQRILSYC